MRQIIMTVFFSALISGCATAKLSKGPDTFSLVEHSNAVRVGVPRVVDERGTANVGTIGAAFIQVKGELVDLTTNYLINHLNIKMALNVERLKMATAHDIASLSSQYHTDQVLLVKIKKLKMFSMDAAMQPVKVNLDLEYEVYGPNGNLVYQQTVMGHHEKRIGILIGDRTTGKLVEGAVLDAMNNLVKDPGLKKALASTKTF